MASWPSLQQLGDADQRGHQPPQAIAAWRRPVLEEDCQSADEADASLQQLERARHGELAGLDGRPRLEAAVRVAKEIVAECRLVPAEREDLSDHGARRELQARQPPVEGKHLRRESLEAVDRAVLANDHGFYNMTSLTF